MIIFLITRIFDVAIVVGAAVAAATVGARTANAPLTAQILQAAVVGGSVKSGSMAAGGLLTLGPLNNQFVLLPVIVISTFGSNLLTIYVVSNRVLGEGGFRISRLYSKVASSRANHVCLV